MDQLGLFNAEPRANLLPGLIDYVPGLFNRYESANLLEKFIATTRWAQRSAIMYGKEVLTPRLTAWFGDNDIDPAFSGTGIVPLPWTAELLDMKQKVEAVAGVTFNSVLLNYYRNGNDSVSWHDDRDGVEGRNKIVASVSLGAVRTFNIRNKADHTIKYSILLENGSYLLMKGDFQELWQHRIAKASNVIKPRINLTFRISRLAGQS